MENNCRRNAKKGAANNMSITVQGHEVALYFAGAPNPQVAVQVKQALLGVCFPAKR